MFDHVQPNGVVGRTVAWATEEGWEPGWMLQLSFSKSDEEGTVLGSALIETIDGDIVEAFNSNVIFLRSWADWTISSLVPF